MFDLGINRPLHVIHCDDDPFEQDRVKQSLANQKLGLKFYVESLESSSSFAQRINKIGQEPDVVLLDIDLGSENSSGIDLVQAARSRYPKCAIIMCSNMDDASTIMHSLRIGADDFISKKNDRDELGYRIFNSYKLCMLKRGASTQSNRPVPGITGITMQIVSNRVTRILNSAITSVHIAGESGTGKEVVADIFAAKLESSKPFIKVNCGAITPSLLESELFGHVKGAFTGATSDKRGLIESANGGWIFLDEIGTLSLSAQAALLRAIENQEIMRVGDNRPRSIKVKFISATNEDLKALVAKGKFRNDLWQRLNEAEIFLPPLRERPNEIEPLVKFFCNNMAGGPYEIDSAALEALCAAPWDKGNVRELRNCLRAMTELNINKLLTPISIPSRIWDRIDSEPDALPQSDPPSRHNSQRQIIIDWDSEETPTFDILADKLLVELLKLHSQGQRVSIRTLAKLIGMSRSTLGGRLKSISQHGLLHLDELEKSISISEP